MRTLLAAGAFVALVTTMPFVASCGGGGGGGCDNPPNVAGTWSGPIQDNVFGPGSAQANITQAGCNLGGNGAVCSDQAGCTSGALSGTADRSFVTGQLFDPNNPGGCRVNFQGTLVSLNEISGTYARSENCQTGGGGTFDITRQ